MNRTLQLSPSAMIKTGIWEDEDFINNHSIEDRFMLFHLLTCPSRNMSGIIKNNYRIMSSHLGWDKQQIQILIDRLSQLGDIFVSGSFIWVKSYFDHNSLPAPSHFNQINSRLQEIPESMLKIWLEDAIERGMDVDKLYQGSFKLPAAHLSPTLGATCDHPSDRVAPNTNNNDNNNVNNNYNHNHNEEITGSGSGESELMFPKKLDSRLKEAINVQLKGRLDAQEILDELAAALEKGQIKSPSLWIGGVIKNGPTRTTDGLAMEDKRKAIVAARNKEQ